MKESEVSKIIESEINGNPSRSNAHGVELKRCLVAPVKQVYENGAKENETVNYGSSWKKCRKINRDTKSSLMRGRVCSDLPPITFTGVMCFWVCMEHFSKRSKAYSRFPRNAAQFFQPSLFFSPFPLPLSPFPF